MSERIIINHFGPLKTIDLTLQDIHVFIGPQASGKSTLAKLIHFCRYITSATPFSSAEPDDLLFVFKKIFPDTFLQNSPQAKIEYTSNERLGFNLVFENNRLHYNTLRRGTHRAIMVPASRAIYALVSQSMFSLAYENIAIDPTILAFGRTMEGIRRRFSLTQLAPTWGELVTAILKGQIQIVNGEERIYFESNQYVTLSQASSGQQEALPLLLILLDVGEGEERYLTLEEPEAHLYPYSQFKLVELLSQVYQRSVSPPSRFVITTHSPYILTSFNNLLFAYQVAQCNEKARQAVANCLPMASWLNPAYFAAHYVSDGQIRSIMDKGLIADNEIDDTSEDIAEVFDQLLNLYRQCK